MQTEEKEFKVELKRIFRGYRRVTRKLVQDLQQLGFRLVDSKKHYKIYYRNDSHHAVVIGKTESDWRAGLNICSQLSHLAAETNPIC